MTWTLPPTPPDETPVETPTETPEETLTELPEETLTELPEETLDEIPVETLDEIPTETLDDETVVQALDEETPEETLNETTSGTLDNETTNGTANETSPPVVIGTDEATMETTPAETATADLPTFTPIQAAQANVSPTPAAPLSFIGVILAVAVAGLLAVIWRNRR
ncbi:MAG: hypothetical protein CVV31_08805 [Methanomicrobiales archaeon HGW-Methanomicrobiales-2]|nr:MAG: hypothetical protein CVV31_08805 [Methanomicrobiales archaeon HGW-Methanomicrobiales-2]